MRRAQSAQVILYRRVSTDDQAESGLGLDAQRDRLEAEAAQRGWSEVLWATDEGVSAKNLARPALQNALGQLRAGEASVLVVTKLDRLSRSIVDFAHLLDRAKREGWALISLDLGVDTSTAAGELIANVMMSVAQWERKVIGERTSSAMQAMKRQGTRLGRPRETPPEVVETVVAMRARGMSLQAIADQLHADNVPTVRGGQWWPATIRAVLISHELDQQATEKGQP